MTISNDHILEYKELRRFIDSWMVSLFLLTVLVVIAGVISHSMAIFAVFAECLPGVLFQVFNCVLIRSIISQNTFNFPFGAGKLEDMSAFFLGVLCVIFSCLIFYGVVERMRHPLPVVNFGVAQIPIVVSLVRSLWLLIWVKRIMKRNPHYSALTRSYHVIAKVSMVEDIFIILGLALGQVIMLSGRQFLASAVDVCLSVAFASYMLWCAIPMVKRHFSSLVDLPLPESDQLKIMNTLMQDYHSFDNIGNVYSQRRGTQRAIQIELYFNETTTVRELDALRDRIERQLRSHFSHMVFHLIPLMSSKGSVVSKSEDW